MAKPKGRSLRQLHLPDFNSVEKKLKNHPMNPEKPEPLLYWLRRLKPRSMPVAKLRSDQSSIGRPEASPDPIRLSHP
jgi:hypothetical protein